MTRTRPKFGLTELTLILGMIAILAGVLVPAVLQVRDSVTTSLAM